MHADLLDEQTFRGISPGRQESLIAEHCEGIVRRIKTAESAENARSALDEACRAFEQECSSPLVRRALAGFLDRIYLERWQANEHP